MGKQIPMRPPFTSLRLLVCRPHLLFFSPLRISPSQFVLQAKMSSSAYKGATPSDLNVGPRIVPFFERFYAVSDDPNAHEEYAQSFVPDADFTMGAKKTAGYKGILELRHGLWSGPIKTRKNQRHCNDAITSLLFEHGVMISSAHWSMTSTFLYLS